MTELIKDYSILKGKNLFDLLLMILIEASLFVNIITYSKGGIELLRKSVWVTVGIGVSYLVLYFTTVLRKERYVAGKDWLLTVLTQSVDFTERKTLGIKMISPLDYQLESDMSIAKNPEEFKAILTKTLEYDGEDLEKWMEDFEKSSKDEKHIELINEKEREIQKLVREKPISELYGEYIYAVAFMEEQNFKNKAGRKKFKTAILVTNLPYQHEFHFGSSVIYFKGWWVNARVTECSLDIEEWLAGDRPLLHVEWSIAHTLEKKARKMMQSPALIFLRVIKALKAVVQRLRTNLNQSETIEEELERKAEKFKMKYQMEAQENIRLTKKRISDRDDTRSWKVRKGVMIFLIVVLCLSLSALLGLLISGRVF